MSRNAENLGERLRRLRMDKKMSMRELSAEIDLSTAYICRLEHNERRPSFRAITQLAGVLEVSPMELETGENGSKCPYCGRS
jgi:transcriptional regulator with XRE-family HTH domain